MTKSTLANPLKILGIDPSMLKGLPETTARDVSRAVAQAQLRHLHPDRGGDTERFQAVKTAMDALDDNFPAFLKAHLEPPKGKVANLERELEKQKQLAAYHERRAQDFALGSHSERLTVRHRRTYEVSLNDVVRGEMLSFQKDFIHSRFVTIIHAADGALTISRNGQKKSVQRRLVGTLPANVNIREVMLACQPDRSDLQISGGRMRNIGATEKLTAQDSIGKHQIPVMYARPILRRLRPVLAPNMYLFSSLEIEGVPHLYFEGRINKIEFV